MEQYYDLALLILAFFVFVGAWIYIQNFFEARKNKKESANKSLISERIIQSQNSFLVFYGIKIALDPDNYTEHEACSNGSDPRCKSAKDVELETFSYRLTDGEDYFLYIGQSFGLLGIEHKDYRSVDIEYFQNVISEVDRKLKSLSHPEIPALHLQSIYDY